MTAEQIALVSNIQHTAAMIAHNFDRIDPKLIKELVEGIRDNAKKVVAEHEVEA